MKYLAGLLSFIISLTAWGEDWYEIEVLIFEHTSNPHESLSDPELWPSDIRLDWPTPLLALDPTEDDIEGTENNMDAATEGNLVPRPYVELPTEEQRLSNANYAMRVREGYRLLWHKSWKAPLLPEESSPWILIQTDQKIDDHYRLEGGIRIHLARYLHLHTDLWLTELLPADSEEQTEFHWSQLPKPALSQWPCIFIEESWPDEMRGLPDDYSEKPAPGDWYYPFGCGVDPINSVEDGLNASTYAEGASQEPLLDTPIAVPVEPSQAMAILDTLEETGNPAESGNSLTVEPDDSADAQSAANAKPQVFGISLFGNTDQDQTQAPILTSQAETEMPSDTLEDEPLSDGYPVKEIVHIQSQRRMRSEELHYIDHPKIGVLAIIHPVEQPVLEAEPIKYISAPLPGTISTEPTLDTTDGSTE